MAELKNFITPKTKYDNFVDNNARNGIGNLPFLSTATKTSIVDAINEVVYNGVFLIRISGTSEEGYEADRTGPQVISAVERKAMIAAAVESDAFNAVLLLTQVNEDSLVFNASSAEEIYSVTLAYSESSCRVSDLGKKAVSAGKSAYAYAQEGGYTGSETEFAELLGGPLIVTVTEGDNQEMTADRNAVEIISAAESGRDVYLLVSNGGFEGVRLNYMGGVREEYDDYSMGIASFSCDYPNLDNEALETFACAIESALYQGEPYKNDVTFGVLGYPSKLPNPYTMKISGSSYDGSSEVDFTSTINSMIDAKIKALDATGVSY